MFGMVAFHILFSLSNILNYQNIMEFKRFKRKGLIFNNNSIGLGLELRIGKKLKVFRIERLTKEDKTFDFLIYDGSETIDGLLKKQIVEFLKRKDSDYSFFDGEVKVWEKIKG